jgi:C4-dicarboxylate-specific signal transduction histidine kinase
VDVNEGVREMIVLLRGEATRDNILVGTELEVDLPQIMGDRAQLQQVLMNLMLHGIEAMKDVDGKRELMIKSQRTEKEQVLVSAQRHWRGFARAAGRPDLQGVLYDEA